VVDSFRHRHSSYSFIWAMGGENQDYKDMDAVGMGTLR
jgi:5-keto 4-deoxyuronate isomerase